MTRGPYRYSVEEIAGYCHDQTMALQRLQERNGVHETAPAEPWASWPEEYRQVTIDGVRRIQAGATYREHQAEWVRAMEGLGWTRGPKDRERKTHPDLIQYEDMDQYQRDKVRMFARAVITLTLED